MVQLTDDLLRDLDEEAGRRKTSRSALDPGRARRRFLGRNRRRRRVARYVEGYRRNPPPTIDEWGNLDEQGLRDGARIDARARGRGGCGGPIVVTRGDDVVVRATARAGSTPSRLDSQRGDSDLEHGRDGSSDTHDQGHPVPGLPRSQRRHAGALRGSRSINLRYVEKAYLTRRITDAGRPPLAGGVRGADLHARLLSRPTTAGTSCRRRGGCGRPPRDPTNRPRTGTPARSSPASAPDRRSATSARRRPRGRSAAASRERVAEQPLVRLAAIAERRGEVDRHVHRLAVEVRPRRLGLQRERHAVVLAEPEADEVALRASVRRPRRTAAAAAPAAR